MGLATTRSKVRSLPLFSARNLGFLKASPISIRPSMSWMIMFMLAMAQVSGTYSWPNSLRGRGASFVFLAAFIFASMASSHLMSRPPGAAGGIVDFHARTGGKYAGHDLADFARGVELAGALAAALGELADEVFVALADDVGLDVLKPEALGADGLNEVGEAVVVEVALAVGGGVEIDTVDDAFQERVFPGRSRAYGW